MSSDPSTKKRSQFLERAAPTEQLLAMVRATRGHGVCAMFSPPPDRGRRSRSVQLMLGVQPSDSLLWTEDEARAHPGAVTFCYPQR